MPVVVLSNIYNLHPSSHTRNTKNMVFLSHLPRPIGGVRQAGFFTPEQFKKALLPTGEAVFHLVSISGLHDPLKNAICRMEKHFNLYAGLVPGTD